MQGPTKLHLSFNQDNGNVIFVVEGLSVAIDLDAEVSAAWLLPVTLEKIIVDGIKFQMEVSGRKNDPLCWVPISSKTSIDDYDVIIKQGIEQRIADRFHGTILDMINGGMADMMVPYMINTLTEMLVADFTGPNPYPSIDIIVLHTTGFEVHAHEMPYFDFEK